jgi:pimeloyl-ACP methyl ester carboxylesterase
MKVYNWPKLSIIAHSFGGHLAFFFSSILPDRVDMVISIDGLKPINRDFSMLMSDLQDSFKNFARSDEQSKSDKEPPAFTIDEMIERTHVGSFGSVTRECAPYLLKRNIQPSRKYPGKFSLSRDSRLKHSIFPYYAHEDCLKMASRITMPYLFIAASGTPQFEPPKYSNEALEVLLKSKNFEHHKVESNSHHFHLVQPEKIANTVSTFIRKHKTTKSHL